MDNRRSAVLARLREKIAKGELIVGAGAGSGLSARCASMAGVDLLVVYNSGKYRMAGRGSLAGLMPYGDANAITMEMGEEVLSVAGETPVLAGVCGTDPFRTMSSFLKCVCRAGFVGVQNYPTVGVIDGVFRQNLEETGMGFALEVDMIRRAHDLDLLTVPYVFNPAEAVAMTEAGADIIVAHMGLTTRGSIGARTHLTLNECIRKIQAICDAAKGMNSDIPVMCHGGPLADPEDVRRVMENTRGVVGFLGASSIERLPMEKAVAETLASLKAIPSLP